LRCSASPRFASWHKDDAQAVSLLQSAVAADPSDADAQISLASLYSAPAISRAQRTSCNLFSPRTTGNSPRKACLERFFLRKATNAGAATELRDALGNDSDLDAAYSLALTYLKLDQIANATKRV